MTAFDETMTAARATLDEWLLDQSERDREPERYVIAAGLAVLERFATKFPIEHDDYITPQSQVRTSGQLIRKILARYGEDRTYSREGGRTTRGTRTAAEAIAKRLNELEGVAELRDDERREVAHALQKQLAERVTQYLDRGRLEIEIILTKPTCDIVADILDVARTKNHGGPVAQHLVGATLAIRYPHLDIENYSYTTADHHLQRAGDFAIGDTAIHVTVAPMIALFERCGVNLRNGRRVMVLVPERRVEAARQMAEMQLLRDRVTIAAIETFVGQCIDEMAEFSREKLRDTLRAILMKYNERVEAIETIPGLLIDIPEF